MIYVQQFCSRHNQIESSFTQMTLTGVTFCPGCAFEALKEKQERRFIAPQLTLEDVEWMVREGQDRERARIVRIIYDAKALPWDTLPMAALEYIFKPQEVKHDQD
jgi:hypothetical protein